MSSISAASGSLYPLLNGATASDPSPQSLESAVITSIGQTSQQPGAAPAHHHHSDQTNPLFAQVQQSVTNALTSAQSGDSADPNQIIQQALSALFQQSAQGQSSSTESSTPSTQETFENTLKSYGIDPQQFRNDFLSAIKQSQSGASNPSTAFTSFPSGLTFDTTA